MAQSRPFARSLIAMSAAIATLVFLVPAASSAEPAPGYEQFTGCPSPEEDANVDGCLRSDITGGHFQMGSKDVPISKPMALTGGFTEGLKDFRANAEGGLTPVKQPVPGGVIGITGLDWLVNFLNAEELKLYAVTELVGAPQLSLSSFQLPIKVRLVNPVLGNNCYIGSDSNPIELDMIFGTTNPPPPNEPITGVEPQLTIDELGIIHLDGGVFVDNAFAAPGANGCQLTLLGFLPISLDGLVNTQAGLPSPAGTNETTQNVDIQLVESSLVYP